MSPEPQDRPTAWAVIMRLQRFIGDESSRCDAVRQNIPLSVPAATQMLQSRAARDHSDEQEDAGGRGRKRRRGDADSSRHKRKHDDRRDDAESSHSHH